MRMVFDNNYFNDMYQGIPIGGYNRLINGLLEGTDTITGADFFELKQRETAEADGTFSVTFPDGQGEAINYGKLVFTGKIDEFYDYCYGKLEYRTVRFEEEVLDTPNYQGNAVVNYTEREVPYTRVIEHKHFEMFGDDIEKCSKTVISREYSTEWTDGMEPYYPVNNERNNRLYLKYKELADKEPAVIFGGRLAEYKYYDMAPIVKKVLEMFG